MRSAACGAAKFLSPAPKTGSASRCDAERTSTHVAHRNGQEYFALENELLVCFDVLLPYDAEVVPRYDPFAGDAGPEEVFSLRQISRDREFVNSGRNVLNSEIILGTT